MYEVIKAGERSFYIECPAKIGLVETGENEVVLIDSGSDKDAGKRVLRILTERGLKLRAVFNTHSHADHIGGNKYLQDQTGCDIYARGLERDFTNHTILEPMYLYGGYPIKDLKHKFLLAQESRAKELDEEILPGGLTAIPLPGHSFDKVGFRTADDVVYLADCLSSKATIEKYGIGFLVDAEMYIETLKKVSDMQAKLFIPSHAEASEDVREICEYNINAVMTAGERILDILREPKAFENVLSAVFKAYNMKMTVQQYALIGSTVRSYLTWLMNRGEIEYFIEDESLMWRRK
ncbi:MAG: MBL fold metallo-hydrolase [Clostridia bacterium]|nr:MBL fold metallo-hydrolase [Clostridia bacterium]